MESKFKVALFLSLFFCISKAHTTTYYVSNSGNDNNNGTSMASSWQTIGRVNDAMANFVPGDELLFRKGDVWVGERLVIELISGTTANPIVFSSYGGGDLPIFTAMEIQSHSWTNIGSNIWQANNPPGEHPERLLKDDIEFLRANIQAGLNGTVFFLEI